MFQGTGESQLECQMGTFLLAQSSHYRPGSGSEPNGLKIHPDSLQQFRYTGGTNPASGIARGYGECGLHWVTHPQGVIFKILIFTNKTIKLYISFMHNFFERTI